MSGSRSVTAQSLELRVLNRNHACEISSDTTSSGKRNHERKMRVNSKLVKQLDERLGILEDEGEILKGEFMRSMQERAELIDEVRNHFQDMHYYFPLKSQECGDISSQGALTIEPLKKERSGLLQVLCQESSPSLLTRTLSALGSAQPVNSRGISHDARFESGFIYRLGAFGRPSIQVQED